MRKSNLLGLIGGAVLGLYVDASQLFADDKPIASRPAVTEADKYLDNFPEKIPGAKEVRKHRTLGAKYCLVDVRQMHLNSFEATPQEDQKNIAAVQSDIYTLLDYLRVNNGLKSVRLEGIFSPRLGENIDDDVKKEYQGRLKRTYPGLEFAAGGAERMVVEGKLHADPAESIDLWKSYYKAKADARRMGKPMTETDENFILMDKREDAIIELVCENANKPYSVLVTGGDHAFGGEKSCGPGYKKAHRTSYKDNIAEWNELHPEKKLCLIEVDPLGYHLDDK